MLYFYSTSWGLTFLTEVSKPVQMLGSFSTDQVAGPVPSFQLIFLITEVKNVSIIEHVIVFQFYF